MAVFEHSFRVTYRDCTVGNHVYYGRYLDFLELGRGEFFRSLGFTFLEFQNRGLLFPVVEAQLRYRGVARYDELIRIEVWIREARKVRLEFGYCLRGAGDKVLVEAGTTHLSTNLEDRPERLPLELLDKLGPFIVPDQKV